MLTDDLLPMLDDPSFTDDDLAKLAEVPVEEIKAARAKKAAVAAALEPPPAKRTRAKPAEAQPAPSPEPVAESAPDAGPPVVRVIKRGGSVTAPSGVIDLRPGILYRGTVAAHLWAHHRDHVEPYGA